MLTEQIDRLVESFSPTSLMEMDRVKLMNRTDTKFAFSIQQLPDILPHLAPHYRVLEIEGIRTPSYQSMYFDDSRFSFFRDHHNRKVNRYKVRCRKYVESELFFLEIKHKINGRTNKRRIPINAFPENLQESHLDFIDKVIPERYDLQTIMMNSFRRITLVHKELNERLTLDLNLTFSGNGKEMNFPQLVIAELKQEDANRNSHFYQLMKKYMIRPYRLSKYCVGCIELYGKEQMKYNRFKKKLLKLDKINHYAA
jgi:hypothetical protein